MHNIKKLLFIFTLAFIFIIGLFKVNAKNNDITKIYYKKETLQGGNIYFISNKNFKKLSLLSTNQKPILSASPFKCNISNKDYYIALIGITPMIKEGKRKIQIEFENKQYIKEIEIKKFTFKKTTVKLNKSKSKLIKSQQSPKAKKQALTLWNIIGSVGDTTIYHYDTFVHPIKDKYQITSPYGDQRIYMQDNQKISSQKIHNGKDYAPFKKEKTPIFAAGRGKVVFARDREITGKTIIIQHLPGVFTIYLHLSKFGVKENTIVNTGEYIGNVGNTGISTGPHLHFEIRINGIAVNPDFFLEEMLIDKNQIINNTKKIE
ncbi:Peptidoglycan-specific endopeptidase, M23 family protein [Borrelia duttonii CR2A]|uniref:Peptidoglycan-specific endopeptidase, M23 family protein n=1 Tax=Borrelia duttonii CR2A TaxID=1432657 RepID=W6TH86_9SPIR|nr:M23 family metallopeptidase [Borrelia duttonii]ETZ18327.1 Peptidoglycan-specific endopeptidase, M23 family protein [Borrelia duttonii CR2A]